MKAHNIGLFLVKSLLFIPLSLFLKGSVAHAQSNNLDGAWTGNYIGNGTTSCGNVVNVGGNITFNLSVTNGAVTGTGTLTGFFCYNSLNNCSLLNLDTASGSVTGSTSGSGITFAFSYTVISGNCSGQTRTAQFNGTISGNIIAGSMDGGSFTIVGGSGSASISGSPGNPPISLTPDPTVQATGGGCTCANPEAGEPIQIGTGNVHEEIKDYTTSGNNQLEFTRYYNSLSDKTTESYMLGVNWRSTYDQYIRFTVANNLISAVVERPDGQELIFTNAGGGNWTSYSDIDFKLVQTLSGWILTNSDDSVETFGTNGLLELLKKRDGYRQVFNYDSSNRLVSVTDSFSRSLAFTYQSNLLHTVTTPDGLVLTYGYDSSGATPGVLDRLTYITYSTPAPTTNHYSYENAALPFSLTGVIDENGNRFTTWTYDSIGRATSSQNANGANITSITYNGDGSRDVVSSLGLTNLYKFSVIQGVSKEVEIDRLATATVPAATMTYTYDSNGYVATISDWKANVTSMANDVHDQPLTLNEAVGTALARTTTSVYSTNFHLPVEIIGQRKTTTFIYDTNGNMISRTETDTSTSTGSYSTTGRKRTWTNTFDNVGHLLSATGPRTDVTATTFYTYDTSNNLSTVTDPLGHITRISAYNGSGLPSTIFDANGVQTSLTYDGRNRLLTRTVFAVSGNATTTFGYDLAGQLISTTLPDGSFLNYQYDTAHRLQSISNALSESIAYSRDAAGNVIQKTMQNSSGSIVNTHSHVFDSLSRMLQDIGASSQSTTYGFDADGNRISVRDGLANKTTQAFDALNRLTSSVDPLIQSTSYGFDSSDDLTSVKDPRSFTTTNNYDGFGRIIHHFNPDKGGYLYFLDNAGNRTNETDGRFIVTLRTFDKLDRVTSETYPASPAENISYTYDATNGGNFGVGRLTGYTDETGNTTLSYNERGDVINTTRTIGGVAYTTAYAYDLADHLISMVYPSGDMVNYTRDIEGRISSVSYHQSSSSQTFVLATNVTYMPFGPLSELVYGNGLARTLAYDEDYRLTGVSTSTAGVNVQNLGYAYDAANNITTIIDNLFPANNQQFKYDPDYRLTNGVGNYGSVLYTYDANGNRLTRTLGGLTETYSYSTTDNWLLSTVKSGYTRNFNYTGNGNISTDDRSSGALFFTYNNRNRYNSVTNLFALLETYKYNAIGERLIKSAHGLTTHYHYDESARLLAETKPDGSLVREYVWLDNMPLAQIESDGTVHYIHPDHLGTPQKMTDANQKVVFDLEQQPFGETLAPTPPTLVVAGLDTNGNFYFNVIAAGFNYSIQRNTTLSSSGWTLDLLESNTVSVRHSNVFSPPQLFYRLAYVESSNVVQNLRFPGQYFDAESQLNFNRNRDYDPTLGRYIENDPIGLKGGINVYGYALGNPLRYRDPSGKEVITAAIGAVAGGAAGYVTGGKTGLVIGIVVGGAVGFIAPEASEEASVLAVNYFEREIAGSVAKAVVNSTLGGAGAGFGTVIYNKIEGKPLLDDVPLNIAIGVGAPLLSGEAILADTVEPIGADVLSMNTGIFGLIGALEDNKIQQKQKLNSFGACTLKSPTQ